MVRTRVVYTMGSVCKRTISAWKYADWNLALQLLVVGRTSLLIQGYNGQ